MSIFSGTQKVVQKGGKLYLVSEYIAPDGTTTTSEVEMPGWHNGGEQGLQLAQAPLLTPTVIDVAEREQSLTPGPCIGTADVSPLTLFNPIAVNGRLTDESTHSWLDIRETYDAMLAAQNARNYSAYDQFQQKLMELWQLVSVDHNVGLSDVWNGNTSFLGGNGNDLLDLYGGSGAHFSGGEGNDSLYVAYGDGIFMDGGVGNDRIDIYTGDNVQFIGGAGSDSLYVRYGDGVFMDGGDGNDQFDVYSGKNFYFSGGVGDDILRAGYIEGLWGMDGGSDSVIDGGSGNDQLKIDNGTNTLMIGGEGNDLLLVNYSDANLQIIGGDGADTITVYGGKEAQIYGGDGNDKITLLHAKNFLIDAGAGDDIIIAGYGGGTVRGGTGNDVIYGDTFNVWRNWIDDSSYPDRLQLRYMDQGTDIYFFEQGSGQDTIVDFMTEAQLYENGQLAIQHDRLDIRDYHFADFNAVLDASVQEADGLRIWFDADDSVVLRGISMTSLTEHNFIL